MLNVDSFDACYIFLELEISLHKLSPISTASLPAYPKFFFKKKQKKKKKYEKTHVYIYKVFF
jgi:hypothetical protein